MKAHRFKLLKEHLMKAASDDPIWWTGQLFCETTMKQNDEIFDLLSQRSDFKTFLKYEDQGWYDVIELPSGLRLVKEKK